ncbi:MAG: OmpA family protein, partial [Gemmatimonadota bacterium]
MKILTTSRAPGRAFIGLTLSALLLSSASCASLGQTERGAIIGAASGAVVGGAVGRATGSTARGAIIGAAVGGAAGALIASRMENTAETLRERLPNAEVEEVGEGILVTFEGGILFDFDSDNLRSGARTDLTSFADALSDMPEANVLVAGHTDSVGSEDYNYDLSLRRAESAVDYLGSRGIPRDHLRMAGLGESEPVATNETEEG